MNILSLISNKTADVAEGCENSRRGCNNDILVYDEKLVSTDRNLIIYILIKVWHHAASTDHLVNFEITSEVTFT